MDDHRSTNAIGDNVGDGWTIHPPQPGGTDHDQGTDPSRATEDVEGLRGLIQPRCMPTGYDIAGEGIHTEGHSVPDRYSQVDEESGRQ